MGKQIIFYIDFLHTELAARKLRNSRYSLRTFANALEIDASYLAKCLAKKQPMSLEIAEKIIEKLQLTVEERKDFLQSIAEFQKCSTLYKHDKTLVDCD